MSTREIVRSEWASFLQQFSLQRRGWLVTIEVFDPIMGAQVEARELPLEGVTADLKGEQEQIIVTVGKSPDNHITRNIISPMRVALRLGNNGTSEALEIDSESGATTVVRFRSAMPPEMVDQL